MNEQPMCVKELGPAIGRTSGFVYKMRMMGFRMEQGVSTPSAARAWLARTGFKIRDGVPQVKKSENPNPLPLTASAL